MDSQIEGRLKSFFGQLQTEFGILDRMVYKNKNQHRRCSYFQYLLKVRSDLRLLQLTHLDEIVNSSFLVINGERAKQKVQLLESLKRRKRNGGKHNFLERLQGAARLLSQMVEPMLKAAMYPLSWYLHLLCLRVLFETYNLSRKRNEISTLLARSFFVGFCMTILALLARLRVLVQQILLDVVSVFNMISSLSQKQQSVKLAQVGFEVFREYYPTNEQAVFLECVWETDKFRLLERISEPGNKNQEMHTGEEISGRSSLIQYRSIETLLGDDSEKMVPSPSQTGEENHGCIQNNPKPIKEGCMDECMVADDGVEVKENSSVSEPLSKDLPSDDSFRTSSSPHSNPLKLQSGTRSKVAFIQVKRPPPSTVNEIGFGIHQIESTNGGKEDPIFSLLTGRIMKDSLL